MTALLNNGTTGAIRQPINSIPKSSDGSPGVRVSIDDWKYLTSLETLPQKAGVPQTWLPLLVAKELVDNALDQSPDVTFGVLKRECGGLYVENAGAAIPGTDEAVARNFSLQRPLESSKHIRLLPHSAVGGSLESQTAQITVSARVQDGNSAGNSHVSGFMVPSSAVATRREPRSSAMNWKLSD